MKISRLKKTFVLLTIASGTLAIGCELIVDFDRTRIAPEGAEASIPDVAVPESSTPTGEAGADAQEPEDAGADADAQAPEDAAADADADA